MKRALMGAFVLLALGAGTANAQQEPPATRIDFANHGYRGQLTLRYWYGNNSIDQWFKGEGIDTFANTKLSMGLLNLQSDHWFGILTPEGLGFLGSVFGLGLSLDYADTLVQNVRLMTYMMDFSFAKLAILHDPEFKNSLTLSAHYISYFNSIYDNLLLTQSAPFFGVGIGVEARHSIFDIGEASYKLTYVPSSRSPTPLPDGLGLLGEINTRWFINSNLAFNAGYRFNFFTANGSTSAQNTQTGQNLTLNRTLQDMFHGVNIGLTTYF
ncbi:MAG: hypothetical protein ACAI44_19335 [Candidatus Sericytochromatia bacterium]